ncbi:MAG: saccharopine dehydrogenase NADP-binding domain-containing protein [Cyclobacteriaceae bacterium]|nr:saccharopine dehydrogenase NADP-binding domain-containing protein [Cyclobacteriaceae bacterium]
MKSSIVVYGSYGYTGNLIVEECKKRNLNVILSGRNADKLEKQSSETEYPFQVVDIQEKEKLITLLHNAVLVIHCGGPFQYTAKSMAEACLDTKTHYTDITGEFNVFESLMRLDAQAKQAGIMIMPGTGFDVVPSDCLALHLKNKLPSATHLQLAFTSLKGGLSHGTAKTTVEGLGYGSFVRENGKIKSIPFGERNQEINFGTFTSLASCIPWGDIATAYRSTGIPNIEVYLGMPKKRIRLLKLSRYLNWLLKQRWVKSLLKKQIEKQPAGPSVNRRLNGRSYLWGKVWDGSGHVSTAKLETLDGYTLTAKASVLIAEKILMGNFKTGYQTPASGYGANLILEIENTKRLDV